MEFIQNYNWSITVGLIVLLFVVLFLGAYFIVWYGKLQAYLADEYMKKYEIIRSKINYCEVCEQNYNWIERLFDRLLDCRYKNSEMTQTLHDEFVKKYAEIIEKERVSQE